MNEPIAPHGEQINAVCEELRKLLLAKNIDYKDSFAQSPILRPDMKPSDALMVRISDKIARIINIAAGHDAEVEDEPLWKTWIDFAGYSVLQVILIREGK